MNATTVLWITSVLVSAVCISMTVTAVGYCRKLVRALDERSAAVAAISAALQKVVAETKDFANMALMSARAARKNNDELQSRVHTYVTRETGLINVGINRDLRSIMEELLRHDQRMSQIVNLIAKPDPWIVQELALLDDRISAIAARTQTAAEEPTTVRIADAYGIITHHKP